MAIPEKNDLPVLANLLGQIDCLWRPPRGWTEMPSRCVIDEFRMDYLRVGLPVHTSGDIAARKQGERLYTRLEGRGLITIQRRANRVGVRLVDSVEWHIRSRVSFTLAESLGALLKLYDAEAAGFSLTFSVRWVPECVLAGVPWSWNTAAQQGRIIDLQDQLAPALSRRWVGANCDHDNRGWYSLSPAGRAVLENPPPDLSGCKCRYNSRLNDAYESGYDTMNSIIATAKPRHDNHLGLIPLPASFWEHNEKLLVECDRLDAEAAAALAAGNGKPK